MVNVTSECNKQYIDTFISLKETDKDGKTIPFLVTEAIGTRDEVHKILGKRYYRSRSGNIKSSDFEEYDIENVSFDVPTLGCINMKHRKISMFHAWKQIRQWKRGFRYNRTMTRTVMSEAYPASVINRLAGRLGTLRSDTWSVFNPVYPDFIEAYQMVDQAEMLSCAFHDRYWIAMSPLTEKLLIGFKMWPIGYAEKDFSVTLFDDFYHIADELETIPGVNINAYR